MKDSISVGDVIECCSLHQSSQDQRFKEIGIVVGIKQPYHFDDDIRKQLSDLSKEVPDHRVESFNQKINEKITILEILMFNSGQIRIRTDEHYKFWRVWD